MSSGGAIEAETDQAATVSQTTKTRSSVANQVLTRFRAGELSAEERARSTSDLLMIGFLNEAREIAASLDDADTRRAMLGMCDRVEVGEVLLARSQAPPTTGTATATATGDTPSAADGGRLDGIVVAPMRGASRVLISFAGNGGASYTLGPLCWDRSDLHLIFVRDPTRCFCLCDIPRLGKTYEANLARLRRLVELMGADRIYCVGASSGGFPAMRYGLDLKAHGVMAFSSPTSLDLASEPGADMSRYPQLTALYKKARHLGTAMGPTYRAARRRPQLMLVFGESHKRDCMFASWMEGIPGVTLRPVHDYDGHTTMLELSRRGRLRPLLDRLLAMTPWIAGVAA